MSILLFVILLLIPASSLAVFEADSMAVEATLSRMPAGERLEFLADTVQRTMRNDPRLALAIARRSRDEAMALGDDRALLMAWRNCGVANYYLGDYRDALRSYEEAMAISEDLADTSMITNTTINIGVLYFVWGEHDLALEYYLRALDFASFLGHEEGLANIYNNVAAVHHTAERYDAALEYYELAEELYRSTGNETYEASTLNNIGLVQHELENYDAASTTLLHALDIERRMKDRPGEALSLNNLGMVREKQGRRDEARRLYEEALAIRRELEDRQGESVSLHLLGSALVAEGQTAEGIALLEEALAIARELEVRELVRDDLLALSNAWEASGRHDLAFEFYKEYKDAHDRIFDEMRTRQMAAAEAGFELDLKDREIVSLKREAEFEASRRRLFLLAAGLLTVILALLWNRYRYQKHAHYQILAKNEALEKAHRELEKAAREELAHVTRVSTMGELTAAFAHELNQPLTAIKANARTARNMLGVDTSGAAEIADALFDIREDAERAREIITRLREMIRKGGERRENHDLRDIVRTAAGFMTSRAQAQDVDIELVCPDEGVPILCDHIQLQQVVINLVQNSLAAMEPVGAGRIIVRVEPSVDGACEFRVADQGPEIPPEILSDMFHPFFTTKTTGLGMGLPICRTIIEAHGGGIEVEAVKCGGLVVICTIPTAV